MKDDLISRSVLLERLKFKRDHNRLYQKSTYPGLESAIAQVEKAPAVDAVPVRHGQYKKSDYYDEWYTAYNICIECGYQFMVCDEEGVDAEPRWCPNCGANYGERKYT